MADRFVEERSESGVLLNKGEVMSRQPSNHVAPRRLRLPQRGHVRKLFSWRHERSIFDPSASYYLTFLFAFYSFGVIYLTFFMVVSSFGPSSAGLPIALDQYFGSESVNVFSEDFALGDSKFVRLLERGRQRHDQEKVLDLHILRGGAIEVNGKGVSEREFENIVSQGAMDTEIVIRSEPDATYGDFMRLLDILEEAIAEGTIRRENIYIWGRSARW
jgi:biopolymer transport protein ExbD